MDQRYGTEVWNGSFKGVWNGGMERVWSRSLFRTSYFDLHPYLTTHEHGFKGFYMNITGTRNSETVTAEIGGSEP